MKFKIEKDKLWSSADRRDWVQAAYSPADETGAKQTPTSITIRCSAGALNALGQTVYYQQGYIDDGAHFIVGDEGEVVQHATADVAVKGQPIEDTVIIELINPGPLHQDINGVWRTWWGDTIKHGWIRPDPVLIQGWACCEAKQLHNFMELVSALRRQYKIDELVFDDNLGAILDPHVRKIMNKVKFK